MKKYSAEFGLHSYCSWKTIVPLEHLKEIDDERRYHIYMILSTPRLTIKKDSIVLTDKGISMDILENNNGIEKTIKIKDFSECPVDYRKAVISCEYPYNYLSVKFDEKYLNEVFDKLSMQYYIPEENRENFINIMNSKRGVDYIRNTQTKEQEYEILYIGQAYGKNGERTALNRLNKHEKVQEILTDIMSNRPDRVIYVLLLEMKSQIRSVFDGITKEFLCTDQESNKHLEKVIGTELEERQIINIIEAALINYFKPEYNINFVENFPKKTHTGYKQYFDLDYNCLTIELDLEFDDNYIKIFTSENKIYSYFDIIKYNLFNDNKRSCMYDIFRN